MRRSLAGACAEGRFLGPGSDRVVRERALIVDGDPERLWFMAQALHVFSPGFDVATARSVPQALEWLGTFHPRLLILDDRIEPEAAGLIARLQATPAQEACRILLVTDQTCPERGPSETLRRPVRLQDLLGAVRRSLRPASMERRRSMRVA